MGRGRWGVLGMCTCLLPDISLINNRRQGEQDKAAGACTALHCSQPAADSLLAPSGRPHWSRKRVGGGANLSYS